MKYRKLGNSGLIVSEVALGTMQFGQKMKMGGLDQKETVEMISYALDRGINFIDTADVYSLGESETLVGNALKGIREEVVLATKVRLPMSENLNRSGATRVNIIRGLESSLKRLQTDHVDLYQIHGWDSNTPLEETLTTLNDLVRQGKVRYIGLSNYFAWQAATSIQLQAREHLEKYVTAQLHYSLVDRGIEHEWTSLCNYYNIGIIVWSPLAGGFLSGKYAKGAKPSGGTRFSEAGQFVPFDKDKGYGTINVLKKVADCHGVSLSQAAIAWTLKQPHISSVIIAARQIRHLGDNISAVDLELSREDLRELDEVSHPGYPYPKWMVLQLDVAEDPRPKALYPERYANEDVWHDIRGTEWMG